FHRARAVWIDNGEIHWALGSRAITDINGVEIGTRTIDVGPLFYTVILLKNRNGGEDDVIATCLSEPAETIAQRLRDMLDLPKSACPSASSRRWRFLVRRGFGMSGADTSRQAPDSS